ncbi:MAG TPA: hypothetical protein VGM25_10575 [Caulobacteraceae bacterium]|jgi:hypothetical protein
MAANLAFKAALAGPRLIARSPLAVLAWVAVRLAEQYVSLAVLLAARLAGAVNGLGAVWAVLLALPFEAVLVAAILRAELKPQARAFGFLRLGRVEANMAGLLILAGLAGALIAVPTSLAAAYLAFALKQPLLAGAALVTGSVVAVLALARFAPATAMMVDRQRLDLIVAWRASKGAYLLVVLIVVGASMADRLLGSAAQALASQPPPISWEALLAPGRLIILAWRSVTGVLALAVMGGAVATVWRAAKQTVD